jgi:type II secretion system protein C
MLLAAMLLAASTPTAPPDLELVGVVLSAVRPVALLRSGARSRVAAVGESAFGGRVVSVAPGLATLDYGGQRVELRLTTRERAASRSPAKPQPQAAQGASQAPAAEALDAETRSIRVMKRADVDKRLANEIPRILAETSLIPVRRDGRVVGLTLSRIPEGSLLLDAGLHAGDTLTRINGTDIDGMGSLIGLWTRLQFATDLQAHVLRQGEPFTVEVQLR